MDASETHVRDYLEYLGLGRVVYQPDGNIPPDFLVYGRIAVEVRRLNENELTESGGFRGLESDRISTGRKFDALLRSLGPAKSGTSWFVGCKLERPVPRWKEIEADLRQALEHVRDNEDCQGSACSRSQRASRYTLFTTPVVLIQRASCLPVVTTRCRWFCVWRHAMELASLRRRQDAENCPRAEQIS